MDEIIAARDFFTIICTERNEKSDAKSVTLRNDGNALYRQEKFFEALLKYNESLCFAISKENLSFAYANRSAVYCEKKFYPQCLNNIRLARNYGYPAEKVATLDKRESKCLDLMSALPSNPAREHDSLEFFKLSYESNERVPFVIDGVEVQSDSKYGRKIIATRPLQVGDVVSVETPILKTLSTLDFDDRFDHGFKFNYCHRCLNDNMLDLIPCPGCNATMYCSDSCLKDALDYHKYECFVSYGLQMNDGYYEAIDPLFKALSIVGGSLNELKRLFDECLAHPQRTVFDFDFSNPDDPEYKKNQLRAYLSMARCDKKTHVDYTEMARIHLRMKGLWEEKHASFITKFMLHSQQSSVSGCEIVRQRLNDDTRDVVGRGHCLFGGLINHSCYRNIVVHGVGDKHVVIVVRAISKGEQLFESYPLPFYSTPLAVRKLHLKTLSFDCDCIACKEPQRFPTLGEMSRKHYEEIKSFEMAISKEKREEVVEIAKKLGAVIRAMPESDHKPYPSANFILAIVKYNACLGKLADREKPFKR